MVRANEEDGDEVEDEERGAGSWVETEGSVEVRQAAERVLQ